MTMNLTGIRRGTAMSAVSGSESKKAQNSIDPFFNIGLQSGSFARLFREAWEQRQEARIIQAQLFKRSIALPFRN